uniref:NADH-ubiquinone oxidoreductase chain 2 n=1 Tax=Ptychoptera qinggouensis TaxID=2785440 RepID=A0A873HLL9_9DIPT|nr:NADH dehydrogenase subunit 2 [Ptychoptera qinggouensis]QOZ38535.1 NADH dehydrogenase subunit 2 [Ptychoptera qinggouensis]
MFKNPSKLLFLVTLMMGTLITISSTSWLGIWMGLEINLLSFIPLMMNPNNLLSTEASLKYFLTQALASSVLLFTVLFLMMNKEFFSQINLKSYFFNIIILSTLMLKSGAAPFHFWFPEVMEGLSWLNNLILMTWQKIAPLMLISYCMEMNFMFISIILCILIGGLSGLNQTSLRKIMAYSSINHLGWMLSSMIFSETLWLIYFLFYSFLSFSVILLFNMFNFNHINQAFSLTKMNPVIKFSMFFSLLSLGGLPPFLGFFPKWLVIQSISSINQTFLLAIMVTLTLITLFFYTRICFSAFMMNYSEMLWNYSFYYKNFNMMLLLTITFFSMFGLILVSIIYPIF